MIKRLILSIGLFVASLTGINAQTTLQVGDIAFLAVNHAGDEDFSFILLTDITAGTELFLTDNGWQNSGSFRNNEGILKWTASAAMSCGTEVVINPGLTNASAGSLTIEQANFAISSSGDQILAYQGPYPHQHLFLQFRLMVIGMLMLQMLIIQQYRKVLQTVSTVLLLTLQVQEQ